MERISAQIPLVLLGSGPCHTESSGILEHVNGTLFLLFPTFDKTNIQKPTHLCKDVRQ